MELSERKPYEIWVRYFHNQRKASDKIFWMTEDEEKELENYFSDPFELRLKNG